MLTVAENEKGRREEHVPTNPGSSRWRSSYAAPSAPLQPSPQPAESRSQSPVHRILHQAADIRRRVRPHAATKTRIFILPCSDPGSPTAPVREDDPPPGPHEADDLANASAARSMDKGKEREPPPGAPSWTQHRSSTSGRRAEWENFGQANNAAPRIVPPKRKRRSRKEEALEREKAGVEKELRNRWLVSDDLYEYNIAYSQHYAGSCERALQRLF